MMDDRAPTMPDAQPAADGTGYAIEINPTSGNATVQWFNSATQRATIQQEGYRKMRSSLRAYAIWLIVSGVLNVLLGFDAGWAAVLLVVGVTSLYLGDAAGMFLVYSATFLLAASINLLFASQTGWGLSGAVQLIWAVLTYRNYRKYRSAKSDYESELARNGSSPASSSRRASQMVWLAAIWSAIGLLGMCTLFPVVVAFGIATPNGAPQAICMAMEATWFLGTLGIPAGAAALSSGYAPRWAAISAILLGIPSALMLALGLIMAAAG